MATRLLELRKRVESLGVACERGRREVAVALGKASGARQELEKRLHELERTRTRLSKLVADRDWEAGPIGPDEVIRRDWPVMAWPGKLACVVFLAMLLPVLAASIFGIASMLWAVGWDAGLIPMIALQAFLGICTYASLAGAINRTRAELFGDRFAVWFDPLPAPGGRVYLDVDRLSVETTDSEEYGPTSDLLIAHGDSDTARLELGNNGVAISACRDFCRD